jgi:serine/threonine-protein kinase
MARAMRDGEAPPPVSEAGEQYALAALVYLLFTGEHQQDFPLERRAFLAAVCDGAILSFAARGAGAWPELEAVLARALSKTPDGRYPSVAAFASGMRALAVRAPHERDDTNAGTHARGGHPRHVSDDAERMLLGTFLRRAGYGYADALPAMPDAPTASVMHGAAGLAYVLYRLAVLRSDADMLQVADLWATRAIAAADAPDAFADSARGLTSAVHSAVTPFHTIAGVYCVRALIANAGGDRQGVADAVREYIASSPVPAQGANPDLMLGHSGVLIANAMLLDALPPVHGMARGWLAEHGAGVLAAVENTIRPMPAMRDVPDFSAMGAAHGWTGVLYAVLRWAGAGRGRISPEIEGRLWELASYGRPWGRGMRWPHTLDPHSPEHQTYLSGWCNGTAGLVHLWTLAARLTSDAAFDDLADRAAWSTWEHASDSNVTVCCGLAGLAYALLARYAATADDAWYRRAVSLASRAARADAADPPPHPDSLYHGTAGIALLIGDLDEPRTAAMPFFGSEGWQWERPPISGH